MSSKCFSSKFLNIILNGSIVPGYQLIESERIDTNDSNGYDTYNAVFSENDFVVYQVTYKLNPFDFDDNLVFNLNSSGKVECQIISNMQEAA